MTTNRSIRLALELEPSKHGIRGSLHDELGRHHRFLSWLGLLQLIEAGRSRAERTYTESETREVP